MAFVEQTQQLDPYLLRTGKSVHTIVCVLYMVIPSMF